MNIYFKIYLHKNKVFYFFRNILSDIFWVEFDIMVILSQKFEFTFDLHILRWRSEITTAELNEGIIISETLIEKLAIASVSKSPHRDMISLRETYIAHTIVLSLFDQV